MARPSLLPVPAENLVLKTLRQSQRPLGAYEILRRLQRFGVKSSPIIYRALELLMGRGEVHKVKELNAYVACDCEPGHSHSLSVLTVCGECREVQEVHDHGVIRDLEGLRARGVPLLLDAVVELPVLCPTCAG